MEKLFQLFYECSGLSTDSRKIEKDVLFIALKGEQFNGNIYAKEALKKGAKYAIVDEKEYADENAIFYVEDCLIFLQKLAEHHRKKFNIPIIGITGTNGKTTTKELIAKVLSEKYNVHYTSGNLNNHIGVPLTLLKLSTRHEIAIIEMGASKLGDIKELCDIAHPTHGIITNIGIAHIEGFGSHENIVTTKTELYRAVAEKSGHLFYNIHDSNLLNNIPDNCTLSSYGETDEATIEGTFISSDPLIEISWTDKSYTSPTLSTQMVGRYNFYNMLAAICIGHFFHVSNEAVNHALITYKSTNNRSQLERTENNTLIIDCYNANPTSTKAALENFAEMKGENKLFVLGDMLELGENSLNYHKEIVNLSKSLHLQGVFVGNIYSEIAKSDTGILAFKDTTATKSFFETAKPKDNLILLKGSRGIGLENLIEIF